VHALAFQLAKAAPARCMIRPLITGYRITNRHLNEPATDHAACWAPAPSTLHGCQGVYILQQA
jgi:hypothetical protein